MFHQIFLSPHVKQSAIIELPHKSQNDLRLRILENKERSEKSQNFTEL